jgi:hypothetical protein
VLPTISQTLTPTIPNASFCFGIHGNRTHCKKYLNHAVLAEMINFAARPFVAKPVAK